MNDSLVLRILHVTRFLRHAHIPTVQDLLETDISPNVCWDGIANSLRWKYDKVFGENKGFLMEEDMNIIVQRIRRWERK